MPCRPVRIRNYRPAQRTRCDGEVLFMPILVECDICGDRIHAPNSRAGSTIRCKECGAENRVPDGIFEVDDVPPPSRGGSANRSASRSATSHPQRANSQGPSRNQSWFGAGLPTKLLGTFTGLIVFSLLLIFGDGIAGGLRGLMQPKPPPVAEQDPRLQRQVARQWPPPGFPAHVRPPRPDELPQGFPPGFPGGFPRNPPGPGGAPTREPFTAGPPTVGPPGQGETPVHNEPGGDAPEVAVPAATVPGTTGPGSFGPRAFGPPRGRVRRSRVPMTMPPGANRIGPGSPRSSGS